MSEALERTVAEREPFIVDNDMKAEWCLDKIRKAKANQAREKAELQRQMQFYQEQIEIVDREAKEEVDFFESMLRGYFNARVDAGFTKATKTKTAYKLPTGNLVLAHREPEFEYKKDQQKAIDFCKANDLTQYVKVKEELNWSELKKVVKVSGNSVVTTDGEIVPGITVTARDDEFKVEV